MSMMREKVRCTQKVAQVSIFPNLVHRKPRARPPKFQGEFPVFALQTAEDQFLLAPHGVKNVLCEPVLDRLGIFLDIILHIEMNLSILVHRKNELGHLNVEDGF
jgi:hypothetical protein